MSILTREGSVLDIAGTSGVSIDIEQLLANIRNDSLTVIGSTGVITPDNVYYIRKPTTPTWGYVVVGGKAMYDSLNSIDFEIHSSEENKLIYKILKFAGISIQREDLTRSGQGLELSQIQREKQ